MLLREVAVGNPGQNEEAEREIREGDQQQQDAHKAVVPAGLVGQTQCCCRHQDDEGQETSVQIGVEREGETDFRYMAGID